ncbi:hypothetical protein [Aquimarina agarivorans]|uniref:hypothetical protein n=1 Tax=Aquimarina agarivorans TaxID=980584 RepID=UPI000248E653|nr:hypothetical protein [Aquimarina agarivorans]
MKKITILSFLVMLSQICVAQTEDVYDLDQMHTRRKIRGHKQIPILEYVVETAVGYSVNGRVDNPSKISGQFKKIGRYFVVNKKFSNLFFPGQLITITEVSKHNLLVSNHVDVAQMLFEDVATKKRYIADTNFLQHYAFSINGKYNKHGDRFVASN